MIKKIYKTILSERQRNDIYFFLFRWRALQYRGKQVECVCCGGYFSKFLPYGNEVRENAVCPRCNALERNRVLWLFLEKELQITDKKWKILHFAPERTLEKKLKSLPHLDYFGADINPNLADHEVDITNIPFPDDTFDLIICSHVLGHVPDEAKAIREMKRALKSDGQMLAMTIIDHERAQTYENDEVHTPADRLKHYGEHDLVRLHGADFGKRLTASGFQVKEIDYRLEFTPQQQQTWGLGDGSREKIFLCVK